MAFNIDESGNITCYQGDSGSLTINGIPTDKNYTVYFAIQNEKRQAIGNEIYVSSNNASNVVFSITPSLTNLLTVKANEDYAIYYYGVKLCDNNTNLEDTLQIAGSALGDLNTITVYPKKVEGIVNG